MHQDSKKALKSLLINLFMKQKYILKNNKLT